MAACIDPHSTADISLTLEPLVGPSPNLCARSRYSIYLLYWCKTTNSDAEAGTKVRTLTQKWCAGTNRIAVMPSLRLC
jgi:hypothetical protein